MVRVKYNIWRAKSYINHFREGNFLLFIENSHLLVKINQFRSVFYCNKFVFQILKAIFATFTEITELSQSECHSNEIKIKEQPFIYPED